MYTKHYLAILVVLCLIQLALPSVGQAMVTPGAKKISDVYELQSYTANTWQFAGAGMIAALKCPTIYAVRYGETLYSIAARCGTTAVVLMRANGLRTARVWPGQRLYIPAPKSVPAPQPTPPIHRRPAP